MTIVLLKEVRPNVPHIPNTKKTRRWLLRFFWRMLDRCRVYSMVFFSPSWEGFRDEKKRIPVCRVSIFRTTNEKETTNWYSKEATEDVNTKYSRYWTIKNPYSSIGKSLLLYLPKKLGQENKNCFRKLPKAHVLLTSCSCVCTIWALDRSLTNYYSFDMENLFFSCMFFNFFKNVIRFWITNFVFFSANSK